MKKSIIRMFFCFSFVFFLAGVGVVYSAEFISVGTHPTGSFFNVIGTAVAKVIGDHSLMRTTVKPMKGPVAWYPYMERDAIDLGVLNVWDAEKGWLGESVYKKLSRGKGFSTRLVAISISNLGCLVVGKNSEIYKYSDLKGKRVAGNYPTPSLQLQVEAYLANGGLSWDDVVPVSVNSVSEGVRVVIEGRSDASGAAALGMPIINELNAKKGARILPIDSSPDAVIRARKFFPGYLVKVSPGPGKTGIEKEQYLWGYDIYLVCRENLSDNSVYSIVKTLWENNAELGKIHKRLKEWTTDKFVSTEALVPYHPGAIRFYKEKGVWTDKMAKLQEALLKKKVR